MYSNHLIILHVQDLDHSFSHPAERGFSACSFASCLKGCTAKPSNLFAQARLPQFWPSGRGDEIVQKEDCTLQDCREALSQFCNLSLNFWCEIVCISSYCYLLQIYFTNSCRQPTSTSPDEVCILKLVKCVAPPGLKLARS